MNWKRFFAAVFALLVVLSLGSTRVSAQTSTTGDIAGAISDPSGAVVPGAKVTLKDETKGSTQETSTNNAGVYHFYLLSPRALQHFGDGDWVSDDDQPRTSQRGPDHDIKCDPHSGSGNNQRNGHGSCAAFTDR